VGLASIMPLLISSRVSFLPLRGVREGEVSWSYRDDGVIGH
jgi:hypothetical protein